MRRKYPAQPIAAVGVIVRSDDRVLLIRRGKEPFQGYWTFPGGVVELGETAQSAACREAKEETGLEVELEQVAAVVDNIVRDGAGQVAYHYVVIDYYAHPVGGALQPGSDVDGVRWVGRGDLEGLAITAKASQMLREMLAPAGQSGVSL